MTQKIINTGTADKGNGDPIRTAFTKVNENFTELYNSVSAVVVTGATAPTSPGVGDLWWDTESGRMYVYYGTSWVDASPVDGAGISSTNQLVNGAYTTSLGANGVLTLPDGSIINGSTIRGIAGTGELNYTGITIGPNSNDAEKTWMWVDHENAYISTNNSANTWTFNNNGGLTFPQGTFLGYSDPGGFIIDGAVDKDIAIYTYNGADAHGWTFGTDGSLTFPDGTTTTGKGITLPVNQSLTVTVSHDEPPPGHTNTFKINPESIKLPTGNGVIFSGTEAAANAWHLDAANKTLFFPDAGDGVFPQIKYSTTGNDGMQLFTAAKPIKITVEPNNWTFGTDGTTQFPSNRITQTLDTDLTVRLSETLITDVTSIVPGTGYSNGTATTTGGSGTGLIISINTDGAGHVNQAHNFISLGQGYKLGDVITIVGGNNDAQVTLTGSTPNRDWTFGSDGSLTLPIGVSIDSSVGPLYPKIIADSGKLFSIQGQGNTGSAALAWTVDPDAAGQYAAVSVSRGGGDNLAKVVLQAQSDSGDVATAKTWRFDETGRLTLPATSSILTNETALNIATHPTTTYTFNQAYWAALNGDTARIFTPTFNAQYFACTVTANQNGAYTVAVTGTGNGFVSDNWFKIPGNELGGTSPANDIQITIATVDGGGGILTTTITGTAVSKQWQFGSTGSLTLPDSSVIASYKPVTVIAATTTAQTITDNASAAFIQFVETVDTAGAFSPGTFTAPYTGYYQINMSVYFSTAVSLTSTSFLLIDTNLDFTKQVRIIDGNWAGSYLHYSTVISAAAGDAIRVAFRQVSGGDVEISSGSRLTIHRVSIS